MEPVEAVQKAVLDLRAKGWTQTQIGEAVGRDQSAISKIESGRTKTPNWQTANKLIRLASLAPTDKAGEVANAA